MDILYTSSTQQHPQEQQDEQRRSWDYCFGSCCPAGKAENYINKQNTSGHRTQPSAAAAQPHAQQRHLHDTLATPHTASRCTGSKKVYRRFSPHLRMAMDSAYVILLIVCALLPLGVLGIGCPNGCVCNDDTYVVQCEHSKLDVLPITLNPSIQRLVLRNNKIKTVDAAFHFYRDLQYVDLSNNHLVNIPTRSFQYQEKLQELHLNNNKLSVINNTTFQGLKSLTVLSLRQNFLLELPRGLFSILPKLEELNLGHNRISHIDALAFDGLLSLRVLYLDNNQLTQVPSVSFPAMANLAELHVGLNEFSSLADGSFEDLGKLAVLDLNRAGLSNISDGAFRGLFGLRTLNLADNRLRVIPTRQLAQLQRLEELNLGQNDFTAINTNAFRNLSNLRKLDITGAQMLETVERGAFSDNLNLETLILTSNKKLVEIQEGALTGLPNLRHVNLRGNAFTTFQESLLPWTELKSLEMSDNPVRCDCQMLWLGNLLATKNMTNVVCVEPSHVHDKPLRTLTADDLGCSFRDPRQQAILVTLCVTAVILISGLCLFMYRYRQRVREAVKEYKWNKRAISRKEHEYQKTFSEDEYNNIMRHAQQHHIKPIPVTEL